MSSIPPKSRGDVVSNYHVIPWGEYLRGRTIRGRA